MAVDGFFEEGASLEFARWMYATLASQMPEKMKEREEQWLIDHDDSVKMAIAMLKDNDQRGGAGQPAAACESQPGGKDKPQPETEAAPR